MLVVEVEVARMGEADRRQLTLELHRALVPPRIGAVWSSAVETEHHDLPTQSRSNGQHERCQNVRRRADNEVFGQVVALWPVGLAGADADHAPGELRILTLEQGAVALQR